MAIFFSIFLVIPSFFLCTLWIMCSWTSVLLLAFCLSVFLLLTTAPPDCTQLPDASFPKPTGTYRCFLVSKRPSVLQSSLSFSHLGSWHAYVRRGLQVCAYHFLNFHLASTSCLSTLVVVGVQKNYTPNGCLISCSEAPMAASDSRPVALPWSCLPHTGNSFWKNLLIYPVNASKKTHM